MLNDRTEVGRKSIGAGLQKKVSEYSLTLRIFVPTLKSGPLREAIRNKVLKQ